MVGFESRNSNGANCKYEIAAPHRATSQHRASPRPAPQRIATLRNAMPRATSRRDSTRRTASPRTAARRNATQMVKADHHGH
jgi:hypothetical protein